MKRIAQTSTDTSPSSDPVMSTIEKLMARAKAGIRKHDLHALLSRVKRLVRNCGTPTLTIRNTHVGRARRIQRTHQNHKADSGPGGDPDPEPPRSNIPANIPASRGAL